VNFGFRLLPVSFVVLMSVSAVAAPNSSDADKPGRRVRLGGISVNANYMSGPAWYPYGYGGFYPGWSRYYMYDPFWYSPYIHPGLYNGFGYRPNMGEVKLNSPNKEAAVYIDGAYAGPAEKLKHLWLEPGAYNLEVRDAAGLRYERRIYVLTGKSLQIQAELEPMKEPSK
jgi:hypothetical protein